MPSITCLDSSPVTEEERQEALRMYSWTTPSKPANPIQDIRSAPPRKPSPEKVILS